MTQIFVSGASGRLGRRIVAKAAVAADVTLSGALLRSTSSELGQPVPGFDGLDYRADLEALQAGDIYIEVATKDHALDRLNEAAAKGAALLVATTGFSAEERLAIEAHQSQVPVMIAANLSPGVAILEDLVRQAAGALSDYHLEIVELHHAQKRDAPSGTAWALARAAAEARQRDADRDAICARSGEVGARSETEVGMFGVRGGQVVGEHTVYLFGPNERLELTHRAADRDVFADGALLVARRLTGKPAGLYTMQSLLKK